MIDSLWRVSVATYNRVLFPDPRTGSLMLALERRAAVRKGQDIRVRSQPFGGGVRILDPGGLQKLIGQIQFDSERSRREQDFRILIPPSQWEAVKQYCLHRLGNSKNTELESTPDRELVEEFAETLGVSLQPDQYTYQPVGFVIEDHPVPTENAHAPGRLTVRLYRTFEVRIVDEALSRMILKANQQYSDQDLRILALKDFQHNGRGHAKSVLSLPLSRVSAAFLALSLEMRYRKVIIDDHELDESVLTILGDVEVPQYQRV
jgi:hypothetical protein